MIKVKTKGSFSNTERFLNRATKGDIYRTLEKYGQQGVDALASVTPRDSGVSAASWSYKITRTRSRWSMTWHNNNMAGSTPVVILLQYGHATRGGTYVEGVDFINPAIASIFVRMADEVWKEVTRR